MGRSAVTFMSTPYVCMPGSLKVSKQIIAIQLASNCPWLEDNPGKGEGMNLTATRNMVEELDNVSILMQLAITLPKSTS